VVAENDCVTGVLRVNISDDVAPGEESEHCFSNPGVDGRAVSCVPDDKCVIAADASEIAVIRTEGKLQHALKHSFEDCDGLACLVIPQYDWGFRNTLEFSSELARGHKFAVIRNCNAGDFHVMAAEELLLVFVVERLDNQETSIVVN